MTILPILRYVTYRKRISYDLTITKIYLSKTFSTDFMNVFGIFAIQSLTLGFDGKRPVSP